MHANRRLSRGFQPADRWIQAVVLVLLVFGTAASMAVDEEFLLPEQAFQVTATADGAAAVRARWTIADGYYLYKSKFRFTSPFPDVELGDPELPTAQRKQDAFFGEVEVYRGQVEVRIPVTRRTNTDALTIEATSQGCADAGLCYPPQRQTLVVRLPQTAAEAAPLRVAAAVPDVAPAPLTGHRPGGPISGIAQSLVSQVGPGIDDDLLTAEQAFVFQAELGAPERIDLTWDIAPGTYLYREKVEIALDGATDVSLGAFQLPPGEIKRNTILPDGSTGDVAVYHDRVALALPLLRHGPAESAVTVVAKYQGCAERGICYPPQTQRVTLALPPAAQVAAAGQQQAQDPSVSAPPATDRSVSAPEPVAEQDRIASVLAERNLWTVIALFFGFGLLLAFTPCVFPMIPILSGIIAGVGPGITTRRAFTLSLVYVLAMALTYTVAGVLAGLFGANLQAAFQNPWILSAFALIFVLLALSMFGFYDLQLPSSLQSRLAEVSNKQAGGTLIGVAIMGLLSALIVGPCVAPPLFGALIYISQTGDAVLGGVALFALSLGMGAPLVAIGTSAGKLLPRAGAWMDAVKAVFGVALLAVALTMLERILPAAVALLLWGLLLICSAVYLGALNQIPAEASGWTRLWKGLGVGLLIYGALMLVGAAAGGKDTVQPLRGLLVGGGAGSALPHAQFKRIKTTADLDRELAAATTAGKPVMLDFYADWCVSCKEMERYTFSDPTVIQELGRFVLLQADVTANDAADQALMQGRFKLPGPPAILFFDSAGTETPGLRLVGFKPADAFAAHLRRIAP
jgi:thiol:disulfide interchange protein DsbD|nr:protein-disulfide reductase DsbD [uncultured Lamprocystis sp.]